MTEVQSYKRSFSINSDDLSEEIKFKNILIGLNVPLFKFIEFYNYCIDVKNFILNNNILYNFDIYCEYNDDFEEYSYYHYINNYNYNNHCNNKYYWTIKLSSVNEIV